jgi:colanic acid/amylovoran biosynthesis glycosyltransferase
MLPNLRIIIYNGSFDLPSFVLKLAEHLEKNGQSVAIMGHSNKFSASQKNHIHYLPLPYYYANFRLFFKFFQLFATLLITRPKQLTSIVGMIRKDVRKNKGHKGRKNWLMEFIRLSYANRFKADIIHNQWAPALPSLEPLFEHYPVVQSLHGKLVNITPYHKIRVAGIYQKFFPLVKGFQCVSHDSLKHAMNFGASDKNATVTFANVEAKWLDKKNNNKHRGASVKIITVAEYHWRKGHVYALEAMEKLKNEGIDFEYKIIGKGEDTEVRFHVEDLRLNDHVILQNDTPHEQVINEIEQSDIFLLASIHEGFGAVVSEAMALGTPVLSTDCLREPEVLKDHVNAFLIPAMDPEAIVSGIKTIINKTDQELKQITGNAKETVRKQLTYEVQLPNYLQMYQKALT